MKWWLVSLGGEASRARKSTTLHLKLSPVCTTRNRGGQDVVEIDDTATAIGTARRGRQRCRRAGWCQ